MPTVHRLAEKLLFQYIHCREQNKTLLQQGIFLSSLNRIWLLDIVMDAIGYPPHEYDCDHFYYELYMVQPPDHNWFVNKQFSRLYWYQVVNSATTAEWKEMHNILCRDIRILREKLPQYFAPTKRKRIY